MCMRKVDADSLLVILVIIGQMLQNAIFNYSIDPVRCVRKFRRLNIG